MAGLLNTNFFYTKQYSDLFIAGLILLAVAVVVLSATCAILFRQINAEKEAQLNLVNTYAARFSEEMQALSTATGNEQNGAILRVVEQGSGLSALLLKSNREEEAEALSVFLNALITDEALLLEHVQMLSLLCAQYEQNDFSYCALGCEANALRMQEFLETKGNQHGIVQ